MAKILVADDEQKIREVIREYSEFNGHEVTEAADGMTAVGLCKLEQLRLDHNGYHDAETGWILRLQGNSRKIKDIPDHDASLPEVKNTTSSLALNWVLTTMS